MRSTGTLSTPNPLSSYASLMLQIGPLNLSSRLIVGTGRYVDYETMRACHQATETAMVTLAIRRVDLSRRERSILDFIDRETIQILPNTAGCYTAEEAVVTARLARELLGTNVLKLEVIGDPKTLYPCTEGTLEAARMLVEDDFVVLPYCPPDPVVCKRLEEIGCAAVMPLAAPIGSGLGVVDPYTLRIILEQAEVPIIVDAGIGTPSDAVIAMELGAGAVLLNTAIAGAQDPVQMAHAFKWAVQAGRAAFEAKRIPKRLYATASSPLEGMLQG